MAAPTIFDMLHLARRLDDLEQRVVNLETRQRPDRYIEQPSKPAPAAPFDTATHEPTGEHL